MNGDEKRRNGVRHFPAEHDNYPNRPIVLIIGAFIVSLGLFAGAIIGTIYLILWLAQVR